MVLTAVISVILELCQVKQSLREAIPVANSRIGSSRKNAVLNHCARGFTLVELMIIIAILTILVGFGIPAYVSWMPDINLGSAIRNIKSDVELAKSTAIRENISCALVFDTSTDPDSYTVFRDNGTTNLVQDGGETVLKTVDMPKNVTMLDVVADDFDDNADGKPAVGFNSRGIPYTYNTVTSLVEDLATDGFATLKNTNDKYRRLKVTIVGLAKIERSTDGVTWKDD